MIIDNILEGPFGYSVYKSGDGSQMASRLTGA